MEDFQPDPGNDAGMSEAIAMCDWNHHGQHMKQSVKDVHEMLEVSKRMLLSLRLKNIEAASIIALTQLLYTHGATVKGGNDA